MAAKVMDQLAKFIAQDQESFSNMRIYVKGDLRKKKNVYITGTNHEIQNELRSVFEKKTTFLFQLF